MKHENIYWLNYMPQTIYTNMPGNFLLVEPMRNQLNLISQSDDIDEFGDNGEMVEFRHQEYWGKIMLPQIVNSRRLGQTLMMDIFMHNQSVESEFHTKLMQLFRSHLQIEDVSQHALGSVYIRRWEKI